MPEQTVTLTIPGAVFDHLKRRAEAGNRTVQDEIVETLLAAVPIPEAFPAELTNALAPLTLFTEKELRQAARSRLSPEETEELEALHHKRGREGLTPEEERTAAALLKRYERFVLVRAQAVALLRERGHDVPELWGVS